MIRDVTDSYSMAKLLLKQKKESVRLEVVQKQLNFVAAKKDATVEDLLPDNESVKNKVNLVKRFRFEYFLLFTQLQDLIKINMNLFSQLKINFSPKDTVLALTSFF